MNGHSVGETGQWRRGGRWRRLKVAGAILVGTATVAGAVFAGWEMFHQGGEHPSPAITGDPGARRGNTRWRGSEGVGVGETVAMRIVVPNIGGTSVEGVSVMFHPPRAVELDARTCHAVVDKNEAPCRAVGGGLEAEASNLGAGKRLKVFVHGRLREGTLSRQRVVVVIDSDETTKEVEYLDLFPEASRHQATVRELYTNALHGPLGWQRESVHRVVRSEKMMSEHWPSLGPLGIHRFDSITAPRRTNVERLLESRVLLPKIFTLTAHVIGKIDLNRHRSVAHGVLITELVDLGDRRNQAWCITRRRAGHLLHPRDRIEARALPMIWGTADPDGAPYSTVLLACPAIRR